jgi:hypothetical protein
MTPYEFVLWLKGFSQAASNYTLTPDQWDNIKDQLDKVKESNNIGGYTISLKDGTHGITTTAEGRADVTYKQDESITNTVF